MPKCVSFRSVSAVVMASTMVLGLAACGKDDKSSDSGATTPVVASSSATPSTSATSSASPASSAAPSPSSSAAASSSKAEQPAPAPAQNPAGQGLQPPVPAQGQAAPVQGRPGTPQEVEAITAMLRQPESKTTMRSYMESIVNNMCSEMINANGGPEAFRLNEFPDFQLKDLPEYQSTKATVTKVSDVRVDGINASANVTTTKANGESETNTMRLRNENGWKMCM